ncbi:MAG: hypothetical protein M1524_04460 [Patescibacteria group bacterium]|nr:hypothetical protein [Patescibacteria group bacterium]
MVEQRAGQGAKRVDPFVLLRELKWIKKLNRRYERISNALKLNRKFNHHSPESMRTAPIKTTTLVCEEERSKKQMRRTAQAEIQTGLFEQFSGAQMRDVFTAGNIGVQDNVIFQGWYGQGDKHRTTIGSVLEAKGINLESLPTPPAASASPAAGRTSA